MAKRRRALPLLKSFSGIACSTVDNMIYLHICNKYDLCKVNLALIILFLFSVTGVLCWY